MISGEGPCRCRPPPRYLYVDVSQGTGETSPLRGSIILFLSIGESPHQVLSALEPLECRSSSVQFELLTSIGSLRPDSVSEYKWWIAIFWGSGSISSPEITKTRSPLTEMNAVSLMSPVDQASTTPRAKSPDSADTENDRGVSVDWRSSGSDSDLGRWDRLQAPKPPRAARPSAPAVQGRILVKVRREVPLARVLPAA